MSQLVGVMVFYLSFFIIPQSKQLGFEHKVYCTAQLLLALSYNTKTRTVSCSVHLAPKCASVSEWRFQPQA